MVVLIITDNERKETFCMLNIEKMEILPFQLNIDKLKLFLSTTSYKIVNEEEFTFPMSMDDLVFVTLEQIYDDDCFEILMHGIKSKNKK